MSDLVLNLFLFSLPFQLAKHFWLAESFVGGLRIDYLSIAVYLSDLLLFIFLLLNWSQARRFFLHSLLPCLVLIFYSLFSLTLNFSYLKLFWFSKVLIYFLAFPIIVHHPHLKTYLRRALIYALIITISLEIFQLLSQSSLGGALYFLGERPLSVDLPNLAKITFLGQEFLRPYSIFSHPNSLAGFLLLSLILLRSLKAPKLFLILVGLGILLTFSKAAICTFILYLILPRSLFSKASLILFVLITLLTLNSPFSPISMESINSRFRMAESFKQLIPNHFLTGIGFHEYVKELPAVLPGSRLNYQTLQPVHNLFLLIFSELGSVGLLFLGVIFSFQSTKLQSNLAKDIFSIILLTGSLDHYWWTLQQNLLIIFVSLVLIIHLHDYRSTSD